MASNLTVLSSLLDGSYANAGWVIQDGGYAFMTAYGGFGFIVFDISNPNNPFEVGYLLDSVNFPKPEGMAKIGNIVFVANTTGPIVW